MIRSVVQGCGAYLPERIVTNDELARKMETSDEWIRQRTGITQRHIAADGEFTSHLALKASERALAHAGVKVADLDLIVLATATPNETFPATATVVQKELGMTKGAAFDLQAVCAGFVYGVSVADSLLKSGMASTALVIGAETFSRILDWNDRGTCVLFGDGAGAIVLKAEQGQGTAADRGILANALHSDGRQHDILYVDGGPSSTRTTGFLRMEGKEVFRHAVVNMSAVVGEVLERRGSRPRTSTGWCRTRPTSGSSTEPGASSGWRPSGWWSQSTATPTRRPRLSRWRSIRRSRTAASRRAICCCWKALAAAWPGGPRSSAGSLKSLKQNCSQRNENRRRFKSRRYPPDIDRFPTLE